MWSCDENRKWLPSAEVLCWAPLKPSVFYGCSSYGLVMCVDLYSTGYMTNVAGLTHGEQVKLYMFGYGLCIFLLVNSAPSRQSARSGGVSILAHILLEENYIIRNLNLLLTIPYPLVLPHMTIISLGPVVKKCSPWSWFKVVNEEAAYLSLSAGAGHGVVAWLSLTELQANSIDVGRWSFVILKALFQ